MASPALRSAEIAAAVRALGAAEADPAVRNPDRFARAFLSFGYRLLTAPPLATVARRTLARRGPGLYWFATARSKHVDRVLEAALAEGLAQLVIVGAGYDSRAIRFAERLQNTRVFEIDLPPVVTMKTRRASRVQAPTAAVTRLALDLDAEGFEAALMAQGLDPLRQTLVICEAVSMFLREETVARLLRFVATSTGPGSAIVFDGFDAEHGGAEVAHVRAQAARIGTPIRFTRRAADVGALIARAGLVLRSILSGTEAAQQYLVDSHGRIRTAVAPYLWLAHAARA